MNVGLLQSSIKLLKNSQITFRQSNHVKRKSKEIKIDDLRDCKQKGYHIMKELINSQYKFSKKGLIMYLKGKPVNLQQSKSDIKPPVNLKGYMYFESNQAIQNLINRMLQVNILNQDLIELKSNRKCKRIIVTLQFQWNKFPDLLISYQSELEVNRARIKQQSQSRLSDFLMKKNSLTTNIQKRQQERQIKNKKQLDQQIQKKQKKEKIKKQQNLRQQRQDEQIKEKMKKKQESSKKMNNFWMKERQKVKKIVPKITKNQQNKYLYIDYDAQQQLQHQIGLKSALRQIKKKQVEQNKLMQPLITWNLIQSVIESDQEIQMNKRQHKQKQKDEYYFDKDSSTQASVTKTNYRLMTFQKNTQEQKNMINVAEEHKNNLQNKYFFSSFKKTKNSQKIHQRMFDSPYYGHLSLYSNDFGLKQANIQKFTFNQSLSTITTSIPTKIKPTNSKESIIRNRQTNRQKQTINSNQYFSNMTKKALLKYKQSQNNLSIFQAEDKTIRIFVGKNDNNLMSKQKSSQQEEAQTLTANVFEEEIKQSKCKKKRKSDEFINQLIELEVARSISKNKIII